jgi:putative PIN family toxin of toxin-antitoxin system
VTRVCLDSNVFVAGFASRGLCADLVRLVLTEYELILPQVVAEEVRRVLRTKLKLGESAQAAAEAVLGRCEIAPRSDILSPVEVRDTDDERVLADALAGAAEILVTGDNDLLAVADRSPIPILSPRAFMTLVRGAR